MIRVTTGANSVVNNVFYVVSFINLRAFVLSSFSSWWYCYGKDYYLRTKVIYETLIHNHLQRSKLKQKLISLKPRMGNRTTVNVEIVYRGM